MPRPERPSRAAPHPSGRREAAIALPGGVFLMGSEDSDANHEDGGPFAP